ncbi:MAG: hypothetical protein AAF563_22040 [Pseudomonadota bacterium]
MDKVQIGRTAIEGLRLFFGRFGTACRIAWVPLVILIIAQIGYVLLITPAMEAFGATFYYQNVEPEDDLAVVEAILEAGGELFSQIGWQVLAFVLISAAAYMMLVVAWLRFGLLGDKLDGRIGLLRLGGREIKTFFAYILWALLWLIMIGVTVLIGVGFAQISPWLSAVAVVPMAIVMILWTTRLLLVFPSIALDQGMRWGMAWRMTKGNGWRLFTAFGLATLLVFAVSLVPSVIVALLAFAVGFADTAAFSVIDLVGAIVQQITGVFSAMVLLGSLAEAYRQLNGPGIAVSEQVLSVFDD